MLLREQTLMNTLRREFLLAGAGGAALVLAGCLGDDGTDEWETAPLQSASATQYHDPNCGCCGVYAEYLDDHLEAGLTVEETDNLAAVKDERGIPRDLHSCHTIDIEGYTVEGHMPVEVIEQLLDEQPDVAGIALPGMPAGSPGMGGEKTETWTIHGFEREGETSVFTEI